MRIYLAALVTLLMATAAHAGSITFLVPGTSDMWLAGMAAGVTASAGDVAPNQSPVLASGLGLTDGAILTFAATGGVMNIPACPPQCDGPDGSAMLSHGAGAENGFSNVIAPLNSLMGVFLSDDDPSENSLAGLGGDGEGSEGPAALDFGPAALSTNFSTLAPALRQMFFIGDGVGDWGVQEFVVPVGATRLFLGTMDGFEWNNNSGSFLVNVNWNDDPIPAPEPATLLLLGAGLLGVRLRRRR